MGDCIDMGNLRNQARNVGSHQVQAKYVIFIGNDTLYSLAGWKHWSSARTTLKLACPSLFSSLAILGFIGQRGADEELAFYQRTDHTDYTGGRGWAVPVRTLIVKASILSFEPHALTDGYSAH